MILSTMMMSSKSSSNNLNSGGNRRQQLSSFILFASVILFVNLCPFHQDFQYNDDNNDDSKFELSPTTTTTTTTLTLTDGAKSIHSFGYIFSENCLRFFKLMFTNPIRLGKRAARFTQADAAMIGKMAKVWYIKKKIKKLGKKLKKHTIAVPVFTAIPIYEHSYYPQHPHVTHMSHMGRGGHAAASSYMPTFIATATTPATLTAQQSSTALAQLAASSGQLATSASNNNQHAIPAYHRMLGQTHHALAHHAHGHAFHPPHNNHPHHPHPHHHHPHQHAHHNQNQHHASASQNQIINAYPPSPPLFVDDAGGLYGTYGNAYGRYDGGYQLL